MRIEIHIADPNILFNDIFLAVEKGSIRTWEITNGNGKRFLTHSPEQWKDKALLYFEPSDNTSILSIWWWGERIPNQAIQGYYLGRFTEILLVHFGGYYTKLETYILN